MNKPTPKTELIVRPHPHFDINILQIICASTDAVNWILSNAPDYGLLIPDMDKDNVYMFQVQSSIYDPEEVMNYLLSYLNGES